MFKNFLNYLVGLIILGLIIWVIASLLKTSNKTEKSYYSYRAYFSSGDGLQIANPVNLDGFKVGYVKDITLDKDYNVMLTLYIDKNIAIPNDSSVSIKEEGFFGHKVLNISLGINDIFIKDKGVIVNTNTGLPLTTIVDLVLSKIQSLKKCNEDKNRGGL